MIASSRHIEGCSAITREFILVGLKLNCVQLTFVMLKLERVSDVRMYVSPIPELFRLKRSFLSMLLTATGLFTILNDTGLENR
jgi:hypothetical protein